MQHRQPSLAVDAVVFDNKDRLLLIEAAPRASLRAGDDAAAAAFIDNWRGQKLAFGHSKIVTDALRLRRRNPREA